MNQIYLDTARLLIQVAPLVLADGTFALKGGTAINLFIRDMPRLSVDLDLVFLDYSRAMAQTPGLLTPASASNPDPLWPSRGDKPAARLCVVNKRECSDTAPARTPGTAAS